MNIGSQTTFVKVELGIRSYQILIGPGLINTAGSYIKQLAPSPRVVIVTDENVSAHWLENLKSSLAAEDFKVLIQIIPAGEQSKSLGQIDKLTDWMLSNGIDRKTTVVALGGGVIGDLAGFAAAITLRGLPFVQIPTTLLAQVDSSVGGKTAIDTHHGKNLIGAFHQPSLVIADTNTLATLPKRHLLAGYAEVVKYGLINNLSFFEWCEVNANAILDRDPIISRQAIEMSCRAKSAIVAEDEYETEKRALLNLGHTFGHAFETEVGLSDTLLHGEGVAIGMISAFELSHRLGLCPGQDVERVRNHFYDIGLPTTLKEFAEPQWEPDQIIASMSKDKKWQDGKQTFILARGIGKSFIHRDVPIETVRLLLSDMLTS